MGRSSRLKSARRCLGALVVQVVLVCAVVSLAVSQGLQTSPYSNPAMLRGMSGTGGADLAPSNPLALPGSSIAGPGSVSISSGMFHGILPPIPNLQFGYLYSFGNGLKSGRGTVDYLRPFSVGKDSVFFGEAHSEFQSFWNTSSFNNRVDVSLGGGARTLLHKSTLLGMNGFYDTSRLGGTWYSSGSLGLQMAALVGGNDDAIDLNFNWYGKLFNSQVLTNAFRYGPSNFDFQAGYSHELWNGGPDFRLSATGYQFDIGSRVYGWNAGAELKSRDGMFVLKYDVGNDRINQTYQTVGAFVNVGFQPENIIKGESPFTMPTPIFKSPRNLWYMLTQTVNRDWHQPASVILSQQTSSTTGAQTVQFRLTLLTQVSGLLTPASLTGSGTMTANHGIDEYSQWQIDFVGDTSQLPDPVPVTVTPVKGAAVAYLWTGAAIPVVLSFPRSGGGTVGNGGSVSNVGGGGIDRPFMNVTSSGEQGTLTLTAAGVQTMVLTVVH